VAELIAKTPAEGLLPVTAGTMTLTEILPACVTSVAPFKGHEKAVSAALKAACGMALPGLNRATGKDGARAVWMGQGQVFVLGPDVPADLSQYAALTDQSDGWVVMRLQGAGAEDVLARLAPIDLRATVFKRGHTARTTLLHMMMSVTRSGANSFDIMVMRSFAVTAVHDLTIAMKSVAARE